MVGTRSGPKFDHTGGSYSVASVAVDQDGLPIPSTSPSATAPGMDTYRNAALSNTDQPVKASAGNLYSWQAQNPDTVNDVWLHFYDAATANVTPGTTTPKLSFWIPAGGANGEVLGDVPYTFATAITVAATTTPTGGTAPATAIVMTAGYK